MKVRELIELLEAAAVEQGDDTEVRFVYNYGDYWKTDVAADPARVEALEVVHSDYHQMDRLADPERTQEEDETRRMAICILS